MFSITKNSTITLNTSQGLHDYNLQAIFEWDDDVSATDREQLFGWAVEFATRAFSLSPCIPSQKNQIQCARLIFETILLYASDVVEVALHDLHSDTWYVYAKDKTNEDVETQGDLPVATSQGAVGWDFGYRGTPYVVSSNWDNDSASAWQKFLGFKQEPGFYHVPQVSGNVTIEYGKSPIYGAVVQDLIEEANVNKFINDLFGFAVATPFDAETLEEEPLVAQPIYEWVEDASLKRILNPHYNGTPDWGGRYQKYRDDLLSGAVMLGAPHGNLLWTPEQFFKENVIGIYRVAHAVLLDE